MATDIHQVMRILKHRDIDVRVEGETLIARSRDVSRSQVHFDVKASQWIRIPAENGSLPEDMIRFLQRFKTQIVDHLTTTEERAA